MKHNTLRSRQLNPCDDLFWKSRGFKERPYNWKDIWEAERIRREHTRKSNLNNPNNQLYWINKGFAERPFNWQQLFFERDSNSDDDDDYYYY
ncbi:hypothetical protein RN001_012585 [Aquatica leii]|uniref:Uncharacterized protein n=1 Tax=Aquatica leii TaxID=1421715 RepID=A0AAN7SMI5_9COLE|nr:hypothetical protein RN001_012585 [Aquatica leii]